MRPSKEQAKENRQRILDTAAKLFRENGIHAVGVDAVMKGAGLTHGGFYGHFKSKSDLAEQALAHVMAESLKTEAQTSSLRDFAHIYLSPAHRDQAGDGCAVAALGPEFARLPERERDAVTDYIRARIEQVEHLRRAGGDKPHRAKAIADIASLVGALIMARAVNDPALSQEILESVSGIVAGEPGKA